MDTCLPETTTLTDTTTHLAVGIDTARYGHCVSFMNNKRELIVSDLPISESADGYEKLKKQLQKLKRKLAHVHFHVHIDAAGQYATNLENFLRDLELPITVSIGQPKRNKDYHRAMSPKLKSDASESRMMARYAVAEHPSPTPALPQEFYVLREVAGRLESQVKTVTQAINRLHNLLARVFPELAVVAPNVAANWVLTLLDKYPAPQRIARASVKSLEKIRYVDSTKATAVQAAAKQSVGSLRGAMAESLVKQAVDEVRHAQQSQQNLEKLLSEAFAALPNSGHSQVETIAGIGKVTAAVLTAKIVSIDRFETDERLVGYFGVFPEEYSSGVDRHGKPRRQSNHMSRKGNDLVRRYLFCAAKSAIVHNPAVRALYARLRARGTRGDVALGHCMRKLLHQVFAVWKTDKPFDKNRDRCESVKARTSNDSSSNTAQENTAQEKAAGRKRDVIPARKAVTAADSNLPSASQTVNEQTAPAEKNLHARPNGTIDYAYLRSQITIEQVLRRMGHFEKLRGNRQLRGRCPFHHASNPKSRSFSVNLNLHRNREKATRNEPPKKHPNNEVKKGVITPDAT